MACELVSLYLLRTEALEGSGQQAPALMNSEETSLPIALQDSSPWKAPAKPHTKLETGSPLNPVLWQHMTNGLPKGASGSRKATDRFSHEMIDHLTVLAFHITMLQRCMFSALVIRAIPCISCLAIRGRPAVINAHKRCDVESPSPSRWWSQAAVRLAGLHRCAQLASRAAASLWRCPAATTMAPHLQRAVKCALLLWRCAWGPVAMSAAKI